jgi:hypothetical protein
MSAAVNFTQANEDFTIPDNEAVSFDATEFLIQPLQALDVHTHRVGRGAAVGRVDTATIPSVAGEVRVNGEDYQWFGAALQTALRLAGTQTVTGVKTFSAAPVFSAGFVADVSSYIGDTSNVSSTLGLTINQGAADDSILSVKSSDVAHGMTSIAETDTYGYLVKATAANGGLRVTGLSAGTRGLYLVGGHTTDDANHTVGADGAVLIAGALKSGTTFTDCGANANVLVVRNNGTNLAIFDAEGDLHLNATSNINVYDDHDDARLARAIRLSLLPPADPLRERFADLIERYREPISRTGLVAYDDDNGIHFLNLKRLAMFTLDALYQLGERTTAQSARIAELETRLALGGS